MSDWPHGILALDLATKTGWASWAPGRLLASGTMQLPKTGEDVGLFLDSYLKWLETTIEECAPKWIVFEAPILPKQTRLATLRKLYGLANITELVARWRGVDCSEVNISTVRKHFCDRGTGPRDQMKRLVMDACRDRGWEPVDDNAADALAILDYSAHVLKLPGLPEGPLFKGRAVA